MSLMLNEKKPERTLWVLGLALTMPMILISGPLGGYLIGHYVLLKYFGLNEIWTPVLMVLGMAGSGLQVYHLLRNLQKHLNSQPKA